MDWSRAEVDAVIRDYFSMLKAELAGQRFNKAAHRRRLLSQLDGRSEQSVEFKHMNISAALLQMGCQHIRGYRPLPNLQQLLAERVGAELLADQELAALAREAAQRPAVNEPLVQFDRMQVDPPSLQVHELGEPALALEGPWDRCVQVDFLQLEARNRSLGMAGEQLVVEYEQERLRRCGRPDLSDRVEHSALVRGDGAGFDVLSFDVDDSERYIEVKTTSSGFLTPFWLSARELEFSQRNASRFHLYRLFDFRRRPRLFDLLGAVNESCRLEPVSYRASWN